MADVPKPRTVPFGLAQQATGPGIYLQQAGGQLGFYTSVLFMNSTVAFDAAGNAIVTPAGLTAIADKSILSNISGASALPIGNTLSAILDSILGSTQGQLITRNASTWTVLNPGTAGTFLQSNGPGANLSYVTPAGGGGDSMAGRLTLTSGVPVTSADVVGATTIYWTPYRGNQVQLWDGAAWTTYAFVETALALGTLTAALCYDVFAYQNAGTLALELLGWTNATTRATAVTLQDGRYCKSGDKTRLYLGTFYTTSTTTTEDSGGGTVTQVGGKRFLWNYYNRVRRSIRVQDTTASWSYTTATIRQANAAAGNKVEYVTGVPEEDIQGTVTAGVVALSNSARMARVGFGLNSTTAFASNSLIGIAFNPQALALGQQCIGRYEDAPAAGYNYLAWLEFGADSSCNFQGSGNSGQSGIVGTVFA